MPSRTAQEWGVPTISIPVVETAIAEILPAQVLSVGRVRLAGAFLQAFFANSYPEGAEGPLSLNNQLLQSCRARWSCTLAVPSAMHVGRNALSGSAFCYTCPLIVGLFLPVGNSFSRSLSGGTQAAFLSVSYHGTLVRVLQ